MESEEETDWVTATHRGTPALWVGQSESGTDHGWLMAPGGLPKIELPKQSNCVPLEPLPLPRGWRTTRIPGDLMVLDSAGKPWFWLPASRVSLRGWSTPMEG